MLWLTSCFKCLENRKLARKRLLKNINYVLVTADSTTNWRAVESRNPRMRISLMTNALASMKHYLNKQKHILCYLLSAEIAQRREINFRNIKKNYINMFHQINMTGPLQGFSQEHCTAAPLV